jgi:ferredoxin
MADKDDKLPLNVPGRYYVDGQCIDCDLCRQTAPLNFERDDQGGYSYVFRQPESEEELHACEEALDECPVDAIGRDGAD